MPHINAIVPELECVDLTASIQFYLEVLGFNVLYERPESRFAFLHLGDAQIMLKQVNGYWETGLLEHPFGRGINFQITVPNITDLISRIEKAGVALFDEPKTWWYRTGTTERGQAEFLVQDPDGYLLRFGQFLGERPITQIQ